MKVYLFQFDAKWENKNANFEKILFLSAHLKIVKKSILVLPEMFATGFSLNPKVTAASEPNKTESFLSSLAKETKCWIIAGLTLPTQKHNLAKNCAVTFDPNGRRISEYTKIHPISILGENNAHIAGDKIETFPIRDFQVSPLICYDLRFPELFRSALKLGTNLFIVIACWPKIRIEHWITLLRARAIENQAYIVGVNRIGKDPNIVYGGRSVIIDPVGEIIADGEENEGIVEAEIKKSKLDDWRTKFPVIEDIRGNL